MALAALALMFLPPWLSRFVRFASTESPAPTVAPVPTVPHAHAQIDRETVAVITVAVADVLGVHPDQIQMIDIQATPNA